MSTTTAQRRGKSTPRPETTVVVETGAAQQPVKMATVRRRFCGTGPFDKHWLNVDCCGLFCAIFTYFLHAYGAYTVCCVLVPPWMSTTSADGIRSLSMAGIIHRTLFTCIAVLAVVAHFNAMTTDPGAVPPDAAPLAEPDDNVENGETKQETEGLIPSPSPQKVRRLCRRCKAFKPQRAHHCSICRRCIIKMDHHCPWVNNCVGIGNHKHFLLFVFYTFLSCIYSMILIIWRFSTCMGANHHRPGERHVHVSCLDHPSQLLNILGLLIEALLFGMFTSCMMFDQNDVIQSKITHIDRLKGEEIGGSLTGVMEVFGVGKRGVDGRFRCDWLSPFAKVCFPPSVRDEVMGFCRPPSKHAETEMSETRQVRSVAEVV